jgi:Zn-dependent protease
MGPALRARVFGLHVSVRLLSIAAFVIVAGGIGAKSHHSETNEWLIAALVLLGAIAIVALHETARFVAFRRLGIVVRRCDFYLFGGSPLLLDSSSSPRKEALAGGAGLASAAIVAGAAYLLVGLATRDSLLGDVLRPIALIAIAFAALHAMPALPLDAGRLLRGWLWQLSDDPAQGSRGVAIFGHFITAGLLGIGLFLLTEPDATSFWGLGAVVAGLEIVIASAGLTRDAICQHRGSGTRLEAITLPWPRRIERSETLAQAADALVAEGGQLPLLVVDQNRPIALLHIRELGQFKRREWETRRISELDLALDAVPRATHLNTIWDALYSLERAGTDFGLASDERGSVQLLSRRALIDQLFERNAGFDPTRPA